MFIIFNRIIWLADAAEEISKSCGAPSFGLQILNINHYISLYSLERVHIYVCISFSAVATLIFFVKRHKT